MTALERLSSVKTEGATSADRRRFWKERHEK